MLLIITFTFLSYSLCTSEGRSRVWVSIVKGSFVSTLDFTVKMLGLAKGARLRAVGQARQVGKTTAVGTADVFLIDGDDVTPCGTVLATGRVIRASK